MKRFYQLLLIVSFLGLCWLLMQTIHELGHVLAAWSSGGEIKQVVLHPLTFSRTDLVKNPHPLLVVAGGPLFGALFPLAIYGLVRLVRAPGNYLFRFFAGFCLIVNGVYIAFGPGTGYVDSAELLRDGASRWMLVLFGLATVPLGIYLWHGQGPHFGLGKSSGPVSRTAAIICAVLLIVVVTVELLFS